MMNKYVAGTASLVYLRSTFLLVLGFYFGMTKDSAIIPKLGQGVVNLLPVQHSCLVYTFLDETLGVFVTSILPAEDTNSHSLKKWAF